MDGEHVRRQSWLQNRYYMGLPTGRGYEALTEDMEPLLAHEQQPGYDDAEMEQWVHEQQPEYDDAEVGQWALEQREESSWVRSLDTGGAVQSTFDEMIVTGCCGQKLNEAAYRDAISEEFSAHETERTPVEATFLELVRNKRLIARNSEAYNCVLRAAEVLHRRLLSVGREDTRVTLDAEALYQACKDYIAGHPSPLFQNGKERLERIDFLRLKMTDTIRDKRVRDRDAEFCVEYILERRFNGEERRHRMMDIVGSVINTWSGVEENALAADVKRCMLGDRNEIAKRYLPYLFPDFAYKSLRKDESAQRECLERIETFKLASKLERFMSAVDETMGDIVYWGGQIHAVHINKVVLTGSDLHERGIGVVIVSYEVNAGTQTKVLKPDERWAEYKLLRKTPEDKRQTEGESIAEQLNRLASEGKIRARGPDNEWRAVQGQIRTLEMRIAKGHGTMEEYVEHVQKDAVWEDGHLKAGLSVDADQMLLSEIFCMLVGMGDMHHENFVYEEEAGGAVGRYHAAMIDADNALSDQILGKETAGGQGGMVRNYLAGQTIVIDGISRLADRIAESLSAVTLRAVPMETELLEGARATIQTYDGMPELLQTLRSMEPEELKSSLRSVRHGNAAAVDEDLWEMLCNKNIISRFGKVFREGCAQAFADAKVTPEQEQAVLICALEDFMRGQVPFYEYDPGTGSVTTHKGRKEVATAAGARDRRASMIRPFLVERAELGGRLDIEALFKAESEIGPDGIADLIRIWNSENADELAGLADNLRDICNARNAEAPGITD